MRARLPEAVLAEAEAQWLFTERELAQTPSIMDGMKPEDEKEMRTKGANFILQVGIMLKLPQLTLSTATVFFNRFLMRHSLVSKPDGPKALHHYQIAAVALFLATKTEENIRRTRELIVACCRVAQKNPNLHVDEQSKDYWRWRDTILLNEDVLLESLCFDLTIESPYNLLFDMLKSLNIEHHKKLRNTAWAFLSDSALTQACLCFTPRVIAASAVYAGTIFCKDVKFADDERGRPWWEQQRVRLSEIRRACNYMADMYEDDKSKAAAAGEQSIYVGLRRPPVAEGDEAFAAVAMSEETRLRNQISAQTPSSPGAYLAPAAGAGGGGADNKGNNDNMPAERPLETLVERGMKRERDGTPKPMGNSQGQGISATAAARVKDETKMDTSRGTAPSEASQDVKFSQQDQAMDSQGDTQTDAGSVRKRARPQGPRSQTNGSLKVGDAQKDEEGSEEGEVEE